jgi:hypothetical protein
MCAPGLQDPSGGAARDAVQAVVDEVGGRLQGGRCAEVAELHNPLSLREGVLYLPVSRRTFTGHSELCLSVCP